MDNFSKQLKNLPFMSFEEADNFLNNLNKDDLSYSLDFLIPKKTPNIIHLIKKHINKIDLKENDGLLFKICFYDNFEIFNFLKETDPNFKNLLYFFALNCSSDKNNKITKYFLKNHFDLFKNPNILKYKLLDFNSKDLNLILKSTSDEEKKNIDRRKLYL